MAQATTIFLFATKCFFKLLQEFLKYLLQKDLPKAMDVKQSKGIQLSMLVLNMYSCMSTNNNMADINPLAEIVNPLQHQDVHVSSAIRYFYC